jgi:DNA polymerase-3 subunit gamma/tau
MAVLQAVPPWQRVRCGATPMPQRSPAWPPLMPADETQLLYSLCLHGRGELGLAPDEYAAP